MYSLIFSNVGVTVLPYPLMITSDRQTLVNSFFNLFPFSLAEGVGRRGMSMAGVLMLGLAVIRISLINMEKKGEGERKREREGGREGERKRERGREGEREGGREGGREK